jgi:DNA-binding NarL/FixJ family response regulator
MTALTSRTAVLLAEHPLWLDALETLLERLELEVVGRTTDRETAERLVSEHCPDMLVADFEMLDGEPGLSAADNTISRALKANPEMKCVVLSDRDDSRERAQAFAAGATAFCVKRAQPDDLAAAIRQSFEPSIYFAWGEPVSSIDRETSRNGALEDEGVGLTKREIEILRLTAEGYSNSQLARMLWVTEQTVKFHLSNIYRKLDVANRTEASRWAQRNGLLLVEVEAVA